MVSAYNPAGTSTQVDISTKLQYNSNRSPQQLAGYPTITGGKQVNKLEVLRKCDLFRALANEPLSVVERLCTAEEFEPGAIMCKQGAKADKIYVIEDGVAGIILEVGQLTQRQVQAAANFDVVGWSALIEPYVFTATVKAVEKTRALAFNARELGRLLRDRTDIGYKVGPAVAYIVAKRLHHAYNQLLGVTSQD